MLHMLQVEPTKGRRAGGLSVWIFVVIGRALSPKITRAKLARPTTVARPFPGKKSCQKRECYRRADCIRPKRSAHFEAFQIIHPSSRALR